MSNSTPDHSQSPTSAYRAFLIGLDGKVEKSINIEAVTDDAAIEQVRELTRSYEVELWDRSRVVIRLPTATTR